VPHLNSAPGILRTSIQPPAPCALVFSLDVRYDPEADVVYISDSTVAGLCAEAPSVYSLLLKITDRICETKSITPVYSAPDKCLGSSGSNAETPDSQPQPVGYTTRWEVSLMS
jgi:hypothetical protein